MQYGISDPPELGPDEMNRNIVYDIVCDITYDMKLRTNDVLVKTYDVAYDVQHTMSYVKPTTSYATHDIVGQTYDIVHHDVVRPEVTMSYVDIVRLDVRCRTSTTSYVQTYDVVRLHRYYTISYVRRTMS